MLAYTADIILTHAEHVTEDTNDDVIMNSISKVREKYKDLESGSEVDIMTSFYTQVLDHVDDIERKLREV